MIVRVSTFIKNISIFLLLLFTLLFGARCESGMDVMHALCSSSNMNVTQYTGRKATKNCERSKILMRILIRATSIYSSFR